MVDGPPLTSLLPTLPVLSLFPLPPALVLFWAKGTGDGIAGSQGRLFYGFRGCLMRSRMYQKYMASTEEFANRQIWIHIVAPTFAARTQIDLTSLSLFSPL